MSNDEGKIISFDYEGLPDELYLIHRNNLLKYLDNKRKRIIKKLEETQPLNRLEDAGDFIYWSGQLDLINDIHKKITKEWRALDE